MLMDFRDLAAILTDPPPGMFIVPDDDDITKMHALILGPFDTPYEGGFFYFFLKFPVTYPIEPPKVKLMTTGEGLVRFNPNFYKNGKVCLSILGTWLGPQWKPTQTLSSVLMSIQSLMNARPYHNEPGYENERRQGDSHRYNECIRHETLRVAVCDMMEEKVDCPNQLRNVMIENFKLFYPQYNSLASDRICLDGSQMQDPFMQNTGTFNYQKILSRLTNLNATYQ
ncbi:Ubiquitin-conjugating enzyme E2 Z [Trichoplax sp. H2]|nr:Ubiquitin-conjugating enzyme E2 Z [Trichoplax sp. H2]|eukprot:RDD38482.1 Ubiquitin-conjugating enzyme E2 Z [Trichoplax sp. H2]